MTREDLHSKSAIAVQLAWRDRQVEELKTRVAALENALERCRRQ